MIIISISYLIASILRIQYGLFSDFVEVISVSSAYFAIEFLLYYFIFDMLRLKRKIESNTY